MRWGKRARQFEERDKVLSEWVQDQRTEEGCRKRSFDLHVCSLRLDDLLDEDTTDFSEADLLGEQGNSNGMVLFMVFLAAVVRNWVIL